MMFTTDSRAEHWFDLMGAKYDYRNDIKFEMLTPDWPRKNFGRSSACILNAIAEYGAMTDAGSSPPAPILWFNEKGFAEILDGVQRIAMAEQRKPRMFSAYVIKTTSAILAMQIRVFANIRLQGGYQESNEWTMEKAILMLVLPGDISPQDCAAMGGWTITQVKNKIKIVECRQAIVGVGGPDTLTDCVIASIADYSEPTDFEAAPAAIAKFTQALKRGQFRGDEAPQYVEQFFSIKRGRGKVFDQFENNLREFLNGEGIQTRLNDPKRARAQTISAENRIHNVLKSALTTTQGIIDAGEKVFGMEKFIQTVNTIRSNLQQIHKYSKR